jgi:hypothetical protein
MRAAVPLACLGLVACASGQNAEVDAARVDSAVADARVVDGPGGDGPVIDGAVIDGAVIDGAVIDARPVDAAAIDATAVDAAVDAAPIDGPPPVVAHVLLAEVVLAPTGGEFIELVNPTGTAVDLSTYYLSDAAGYFRLPAGVAAATVDAADFIVKFPAGASIPPGGVVTVAVDTAANFTIAYPGVNPTYSIASSTMTAVSVTGSSSLTNAGEPVVLFRWDGATDRVTDVDLMIAGTPTAANQLANKSGLAVDGPDADAVATAYATDAFTLPSQATPASARSTKRIALESATTETHGGAGNGVAGHDETSEQLGTTWDTGGYTTPTPGQVPSALLP